jgi:hypothetical protein
MPKRIGDRAPVGLCRLLPRTAVSASRIFPPLPPPDRQLLRRVPRVDHGQPAAFLDEKPVHLGVVDHVDSLGGVLLQPASGLIPSFGPELRRATAEPPQGSRGATAE